MDDIEKKPRLTLTWSDEEEAAFDKIAAKEPFYELKSTRRAIIRYALLSLAQPVADKAEVEPATKKDIQELMSLVRGIAMVAKMGSGAGTAPSDGAKRGPKPKVVDEEAKENEGALTCSALGGLMVGQSCTYKKYEVMATGRPVSYDVTEPLLALSDATVATQYDPSREEYERAVREWKESE